MKTRLIVAGCPPRGNANRVRMVRLVAAATWLEVAELERRLTADPPWLVEVCDRSEADLLVELLHQIPGVRLNPLPAVGKAVPSMRSAIGRLARAMEEPEPEPPTPAPAEASTGLAAAVTHPSLSDEPGSSTTPSALDAGHAPRAGGTPWVSGGTPAPTRLHLALHGDPPTPSVGWPPGLRRAVFGGIGVALAAGLAVAHHALTRDGDVEDPGVATLVQAGDEPRAPLRYRAEPGARADRTVTLALTHGASARAVGLPLTQTVTGAVVVLVVRADEDVVETDYRTSLHYQRPGGSAIAGRLTGRVRMTTTGVPGPDPVPSPDALPPDGRALGAAFVQIARAPLIKLPRDAVGVGARWTWTLLADQSPFGVPIAFDATLTDRTAARADLVLQVRLLAPDADAPPAPMADLMPGVRIGALTGRGEGRVTLDLRHPGGAQLTLEVRLEGTATIGGRVVRYAPRLGLSID